MQDKTPRNANGNPHGRWVVYLTPKSKKVIYRAYFIDGINYGCEMALTLKTNKKTYEYYAT